MKTLLYSAAFFLVLIAGAHTVAASGPTPSATAATATPTPPATMLVTVDVLKLRAGPGTNHPVLTRLTSNTRLEVAGRSPDGAWLAVQTGARSGWVAARYVRPVSPVDASSQAATTIPAPTATPTPAPKPERLDTVVLGPDTVWPVRANHVIGWGYEFVDASQGYDWVLHRDVYGQVSHAFWGPALYDRHPHGIRLTLIDPVWEESCPSPVAPVPLVAGSRCLLEGFGDGEGAMVYAGCAVNTDHLYDPQACFITLTIDAPHVTDAVVAATITAENMLVAGYAARTPDFSRPPFTPLLGEAYREGDQWRWRQPYVEVVRAQ